MPYNTRRKSLSLPSLGIHVPVTHAERAAAQAAAAAAAASRVESTARSAYVHRNKKLKRSHADGDGDDSSSPSPGRLRCSHSPLLSLSPRATQRRIKYEQTPPPSPQRDQAIDDDNDDDNDVRRVEDSMRPTLDLEGIDDEIVEAVLMQLQDTGNRPHLVKELAAVLSQRLQVVRHSANPSAIIASRLSTYLKRPCWSALAPCPLAKGLETAHPRRTYFFLTIYPHQPLPNHCLAQIQQRSIISPSLSSVASQSDEGECDFRRELSQSPEVDLSPPDLACDDMATPSSPVGSLSSSVLNSLPADADIQDRRSKSPSLEKDEREFTRTADVLQKRNLSSHLLLPNHLEQVMDMDEPSRDEVWFAESRNPASGACPPLSFVMSPFIRPIVPSNARKDAETEAWLKVGSLMEWDLNPESVALEELDCLLDAY